MTDLAQKAAWMRLVVLVFFGAAAIRLFGLQVLNGRQYRIMAARNRFQIFYRQAPRGEILDRTGYALSSNIGVFNLYFNPRIVIDDLAGHIARVSAAVGVDAKELGREAQQAHIAKRTRLVARQILSEAAFRFLERREEYPEFFLASESLRYYPLGNAFAHMIGYLTRIQSRSDFERLKEKGYRFDSWLGGYALEKKFEENLRGTDGAVLVEVDAFGRPVAGAVEEKDKPGSREPGSGLQLTQDPMPGSDLELTVDHRLILAAYQGLRNSPSGVGSVVGIEPLTGKILVIVSIPAFDPNSYIGLDKDLATHGAEFPRALTGTYPPGSVFKVVTAASALEKGLDPARVFWCNGKYVLPKRVFKCWKEQGHGAMDFIAGIKNSCDVYFYNAGLYAGAESLSSLSSQFGLGRELMVREFPEWAKQGFIPTPQWKLKKKKDAWHIGDTLNFSIGQGEVLATPVQMAVLFAQVATRGLRAEPYVVKSLKDSQTGRILWEAPPPTVSTSVGLSQKTWDLIEKGLAEVVESGTGRNARIPGYLIYGKTGTAQNPLGKDHALFSCYLKDSQGRPRLALSVVVDNGGQGSAAAAPIARRVLEEFIKINPDLSAAQSGASRG